MKPQGKRPLMGTHGRMCFPRSKVTAGFVLLSLTALMLFVYSASFDSSLLRNSVFYQQDLQMLGADWGDWWLPRVQNEPSTDDPFLFLHNRKCGGTTFRKVVGKAAKQINASTFISCYGGRPCEIYTLNQIPDDRRDNATVLGGHFSWDAYEELRKTRGAVSCFTVLRDPVAMFESYYYERAPPWLLRNITLADISVSELKDLIGNKWVGGEEKVEGEREEMKGLWVELGGPVNSATRMFSGAKIEGHSRTSLRRSTTDLSKEMRRFSKQLKYELSREGAELSLSLAKKNMRKCVVGILEEWEDLMEVVRHWYPWIWQNTGREERSMVTNKRRARVRAKGLPPTILEAIREAMAQDIQLYKYGKQIFRNQLEIVRKADKSWKT